MNRTSTHGVEGGAIRECKPPPTLVTDISVIRYNVFFTKLGVDCLVQTLKCEVPRAVAGMPLLDLPSSSVSEVVLWGFAPWTATTEILKAPL